MAFILKSVSKYNEQDNEQDIPLLDRRNSLEILGTVHEVLLIGATTEVTVTF